MDASVIILTRDAGAFIEKTLKTLSEQITDFTNEIIIIDSSSTDKTLDVAKKYAARIYQIHPSDFGHGRTRNMGFKLASGRVVIYLNGDAIPIGVHWLQNILTALFNDPRLAAVYGGSVPRQDCHPHLARDIIQGEWRNPEGNRVIFINNASEFRNKEFHERRRWVAFTTMNCAIRKETLEKIPFKNISFGEDVEWSQRVLLAGYGIAFVPEARVEHSHNYSVIETMKRYFTDAKFCRDFLDYPHNGKKNFLSQIHSLGNVFLLDTRYILALDKSLSYKIYWIIFAVFVRCVQSFSFYLGAHYKALPEFISKRLSYC